jgi:hypothetical protein
MKRLTATLIPLSLLLALPAAAQVYKCVDAKGKTTFQEAPCDGNRNANKVNSTPSSSGYEMPKGESKDTGFPPPAAPPASRDPSPAPSSGPISRSYSQVDERKFISTGMDRPSVLAKLGEPDRRIVTRITFLASGMQVNEAYIDTYEPTAGDSQTRTKIRYIADVVDNVTREIAR